MENALKPHIPLAAQVVAIGDGRQYVTALVVLDADDAAAYAGSMASSPRPRRSPYEHLSRVEQIKRFRIVKEFWESGVTSGPRQ